VVNEIMMEKLELAGVIVSMRGRADVNKKWRKL